MGKRLEKKIENLDNLTQLLLSHPEGLRKAEIARRLDVHRSTAAEYLDDLTVMGVPVFEPTKHQFSINREIYQFDISLTLHESMALHLASRLLATRTDKHNPHAANAIRKLGIALEKLAPLISKHLLLSANTLESPIKKRDPSYLQALETLTKAWALGIKVHLTHEMPDGKVYDYSFSPYFIEPYAVGRTSHVIGFREPPSEIRTFKIERIRTIELLEEETYSIPDDFDPSNQLRDAWGIWFAEDKTTTVKLKFKRKVARRVQETQWHHSQNLSELEDGSLLWIAKIAEPQEMVPWIRGWGPDVEVLEPIKLRERVSVDAQRLADLYDKKNPTKIYIAHTRNSQGEYHNLGSHLKSVAELASEFADPLHASDLAQYLGLCHDLGKFHPQFQNYLFDAEAGIKRRGPDHKAAGCRIAYEQDGLSLLMLLIQGHHGGLRNKNDLLHWYRNTEEGTEKALLIAQEILNIKPEKSPHFPEFIQENPLSAEFFLRMLFSTLVDADFLDTEAHFRSDKSQLRGTEVSIDTLWDRFEIDQKNRFGSIKDTVVNRSRDKIFTACLKAAEQDPGLFRLTVPTGGGKTRSGMAFALRHAQNHGQQRIIVAVPYITITQQTASTYREIFNLPDDDKPVVLEHHSGTAAQATEKDQYHPGAVWNRLASENWDAPIIVTTTVQLFESLFANSTSRCRKLHRLANSVIILDEAQSFPAHLLDPMLDALRELCTHYGSTVVFSTATQPAFDVFKPFKDLNPREIIPEPEKHFQKLKRVNYEWHAESPLTWKEVAKLMRSETQALAICNTKQDALNLLDALDDPEALHLSTLLCGKHRLSVIQEVKKRLQTGQTCRLVSTQVVEAGVDIDFPLVLRAFGPLDSIIQAAGRANREGLLEQGRVIVFEPVEGGLPPGAYKRATQTTNTMLNMGTIDMYDPATMQTYFQKLYQLEDHPDNTGKIIQKKRRELDYPEVSRLFEMIRDDTVSVIITNYGSQEEREQVRAILARLRAGAPPTRDLIRKLQPYTVSLYKNQASKYLNQGCLLPQSTEGIPPGIWEWVGEYGDVCGIVPIEMSADLLIF